MSKRQHVPGGPTRTPFPLTARSARAAAAEAERERERDDDFEATSDEGLAMATVEEEVEEEEVEVEEEDDAHSAPANRFLAAAPRNVEEAVIFVWPITGRALLALLFSVAGL